MDVGATIRAARVESGLTQAQLAERCGTSQATLSAYERGHKVPSIPTLERILAAAGKRLATVEGGRPVLVPSRAAHRRVARELREVLDLAASLPGRSARSLTYPHLPSGTRA